VYLSGGSPSYLASTLRGTLVWQAVRRAWEGGAALAGCSAGAMALTGWAPYVREMHRAPETGLGVVPHWRVIPHYDRMIQWQPAMPEHARDGMPPDGVVLGIDEETALVRFSDTWEVHGRQQVHLLEVGGIRSYSAGEAVPL
jgi:cyanophycinase-like exopeptidase